MRKRKIKQENTVESKSTVLQQIKDLHRKIQMEIGAYTVLIEEGSQEQMVLAHNRAKSALMKYGADIQKLGRFLDQEKAELIDQYLDMVDLLVHCPISEVDQAKISEYYAASQKLEKSLVY